VPTKAAPIDPEMKAALDKAVRAFLHPDATVRQAAFTGLAEMKDRNAVRLIVGRLADHLKSRSAPVRQAVQAALVEIGAPAVPVLVARLRRKGGLVIKGRIGQTLGLLGPRLVGPEFATLFFDLDTARLRSSDPATAAACAIALSMLSPAQQCGSGTGVGGCTGNPGPELPTGQVTSVLMESPG